MTPTRHSRPRTALSLAFSTCLLGACFAQPTPAWAQARPGADAQSAISLGRDAKERFDRGELAEALALFEAAERRAHSPVLVLFIARCQLGLGKMLAARESLRKAAAEPVDGKSPEPFRNAVSDSAKELAELERVIPRLSIRQSALPADATILVDGKELDDAARRGLVDVDPGAHIVVAMRGAQELARVEVRAEPNQITTVELAPASTKPSDTTTTAQRAETGPAPTSTSSDGSWVPGLVLTAIGTVGIGVGIGTRVVAFGIVDDVRSRCVDDVCLAEDQAEIDRASTFQTVSTVSLIAGGVAAAAGVVLLVVRPGGAEGPSVAIDAGPAYLGLRGRF